MNKVDHTPNRFENKLLTWCIIGISIILITWTLSSIKYLFGFDPGWAGDNFIFNIFILYPSNIIALIILYITGGLAITDRKKFQNKRKQFLILILSYGVIIYVGYIFIMFLRQLNV
jgi:hypothetical protein